MTHVPPVSNGKRQYLKDSGISFGGSVALPTDGVAGVVRSPLKALFRQQKAAFSIAPAGSKTCRSGLVNGLSGERACRLLPIDRATEAATETVVSPEIRGC